VKLDYDATVKYMNAEPEMCSNRCS